MVQSFLLKILRVYRALQQLEKITLSETDVMEHDDNETSLDDELCRICRQPGQPNRPLYHPCNVGLLRS